jgi:MOSC domain-containing protein YiiM
VAHLLSVNLGIPRVNEGSDLGVSAIDRRPTADLVTVRAPGPMHGGQGSGLIGDQICDARFHGGDDQALYAYAREDLDGWEAELGRELPGGVFGENLTTVGLDVNGALIGERWQVGAEVVLQVTSPRIPCRTFAVWMAEQGWTKRFTLAALPGAYLRIVREGVIRAGDPVTVLSRPDHQVTVALTFRALTREPQLLPQLLAADDLTANIRAKIGRRGVPGEAD